MTPHPVAPRGPRRCGWLLALLLLASPSPAPAGPLPVTSCGPAAAAAPAAVAGLSWSKIESAVGNRRRMIQVLIVLMCVGLYIMMRKVSDSD